MTAAYIFLCAQVCGKRSRNARHNFASNTMSMTNHGMIISIKSTGIKHKTLKFKFRLPKGVSLRTLSSVTLLGKGVPP